MKFSYEEFDLSDVKTYPLKSRKSKARAEDFAVRGTTRCDCRHVRRFAAEHARRRGFQGDRRAIELARDATAASSGVWVLTSSRPASARC